MKGANTVKTITLCPSYSKQESTFCARTIYMTPYEGVTCIFTNLFFFFFFNMLMSRAGGGWDINAGCGRLGLNSCSPKGM